MTRRTLVLLAAVVCAAAVLVAGCGGGDAPSSGGTRVSLVLDWFPNADHAGIYGAIDEGYFSDQGLDVRPEVPSDPSASLKRVATGKADFAISYEPELMLARSQGVPVTAVAAIVVHPLNSILARTDRGIHTAADLAGRTVGAAGVPSDRPLLDAVLRHAGVDPSTVTLKTIGFNLAPALAKGSVDAVIGAYWNVERVELERKGVAITPMRLEDNGVPDYDELVVVASDHTVATRPDMIRAFLRGLRKGQDWAATDQTGAADDLVAANKELDPGTLREQLRLTAPLLSPSDEPTLNVDPKEWASFATWMTDNGLLKKPLDVSRVVTDRFLPEAR
jgi:putative hydroxymethylpyrimidine transport system substrate-binding protein